MPGKFFKKESVETDVLNWGTNGWLSSPKVSGAKDLVVLDVVLFPGQGHNFHKHPNQEEVIYVIKGEVEQWLGQERQLLTAGDSVFIPADMVHASFNTGTENAQVLAILGPAIGADKGYEVEEVGDQEPWSKLRI